MRIALGVGGGIAAYKAAELARELQRHGHEVQAILTRSAQEFIQPLTFAALTGKKVITSLFPSEPEQTLASAVEHISVAQEHDLLLVAPATANLLSNFAHGQANDFLTTLYLAFTGTVVLAPAMNTAMWEHPATQANIKILTERGCVIVDPDEGQLACGTVGAGRLPDPVVIAMAVEQVFRRKRDLAEETILITAGPTQEPIDPVRYLTNRSSGKMGYALAAAALDRGARVLLVSGPVHIPSPPGAELISVRTAHEMRDAVLAQLPRATVVIKAAAVADYYVPSVAQEKIKKNASDLDLHLQRTPDILTEVSQRKGDRLLIGFAAETNNLLAEAKRKLAAKGADMIVANSVADDGIGFDSDRNAVTMLLRSGEEIKAGPAPKREVAERILDQVLSLREHERLVRQPA